MIVRSSSPSITSHSISLAVIASSAPRLDSMIRRTRSMAVSMMRRTSSSISRAVCSLWLRAWEMSPPPPARNGDRWLSR